MCSIIGSYSKERLSKLAELNAYRGGHSHSLFVFDQDMQVNYWYRGFGPLVLDDHAIGDGEGRYFVAHQQAPTTDAKDQNAIHPAQIDSSLLWHNGIIKADDVKRLQSIYDKDVVWDTKLLLIHYLRTANMEDIDGTFACVLYNDAKLHVFRNEISPLFYNEFGDLSSTKFENSLSVTPNKVLTFDPSSNIMFNVVAEFTTKENPYFFM